MEDSNKLLGLVGLAKKAGKLTVGEENTVTTALAHRVRLVLLADDASAHTAQKVQTAADTGNAFCIPLDLSKADLGGAAGRTECAVVAFTDIGLAAAAARQIARQNPERWGDAAEQLTRKAAKTLRRRREKKAEQKKRTARRTKPRTPLSGG